MRKINNNPKIIIAIFMLIIVFLIIAYTNFIFQDTKKKRFVNNAISILQKNEEPIFSIERIELYSTANVTDNSIDKKLQDFNIYQYADIAIYINNRKKFQELTNENTIKELYIDNIQLETNSQIGERSLLYTNSLSTGKSTELQSQTMADRIDFNIIYTNEQNNNADYSKPTFYTDCSNPITLKYSNKDIVKGYKMNKDKVIPFDGRLLKEANVQKEDLSCRLRYRIVLVNNNNQKFSCWMNFDIPLEELYTKGETIRIANTSGLIYDFFAM